MSAPAPRHGASIGLRPGDIDLSDPKTFLAGVPHEYFRVLREQDPVHWQEECRIPVFLSGPGYWALTRYADVAFVSKHPEIFSSAAGSSVLNEIRPYERRLAREQLIQIAPPAIPSCAA
jgi:cytochrome P450